MIASGLSCPRKLLHSKDGKRCIVPFHIRPDLRQIFVAPILPGFHFDKRASDWNTGMIERNKCIGGISSAEWVNFYARLAEERFLQFQKDTLLSLLSFDTRQFQRQQMVL